jgi:hypothetical protein
VPQLTATTATTAINATCKNLKRFMCLLFILILQFLSHFFLKKSYMRYFLFLLTIVGFQLVAFAQMEEIKKPVTALFDGMRKNDSMLIRSAFAPGAMMQTILKNKEGKTEVRSITVSDFITAVTRPHKDIYDERITYDMIKTDGDLAVVWTPYQFFVSNNLSHCGVNSFQLVRISGEWKIQYIIDTRRKDDCVPLAESNEK